MEEEKFPVVNVVNYVLPNGANAINNCVNWKTIAGDRITFYLYLAYTNGNTQSYTVNVNRKSLSLRPRLAFLLRKITLLPWNMNDCPRI